jgi:hypothetical protein
LASNHRLSIRPRGRSGKPDLDLPSFTHWSAARAHAIS